VHDVAFVRSDVSGPGNSTKRPGRRLLKLQALVTVHALSKVRPLAPPFPL